MRDPAAATCTENLEKKNRSCHPSRPTKARGYPSTRSCSESPPEYGERGEREQAPEQHREDVVEEGQLLVLLEAMKMEHRIVAPFDGVVSELRVSAGDQVGTDDMLVVIDVAQNEESIRNETSIQNDEPGGDDT